MLEWITPSHPQPLKQRSTSRRAAIVAGLIALPGMAAASSTVSAAEHAATDSAAAAATAPGGFVPCWDETPPCGGLDPEAAEVDAEAEEAEGNTPRPIVIFRASGRGRPQAAEMTAWTETFHRETTPFQAALARLLAAREVERPPELVPYCRRLAGALVAIDREGLFPAPDLAADVHLKHSLDLFAVAAVACVHQRFAATDYYLTEADQAMRHLDLALRRYGPRR